MPLATPEELAKYPPPPLPVWITHPERCGFPDYRGGPLLSRPEDQIIFFRPDKRPGVPGDPFFWSNPGPQSWLLKCAYDEILIGGERGGSKSSALIAWFTMGDPFLSKDDPAYYSYLLEPSYRGLMLRKEYQSMAEFVDEAMEFFGPLGGKPKDDPVIFTFKSGAKIYTNHLGDKNAFEKFRGQGISRIGVEELTQIEELNSYLKVLGSLRAKRQVRMHGNKRFPALRSQIMSTCNPDGPGKSWCKKRFVDILNGKGKKIAWNTPMKDPFTGLTRIFIPMKRRDNPYLRENKQYEGMLLSQDEGTRRAWMMGEWNFSASTFFTEWRPNGPATDEERLNYPWANHVIDPIALRPYWYRFSGGDWGYDHPAVFHKFCRSEKDGRIHVYDELTLRRTGSFEMGVALANWWLPDLEYLPDKTVTIAFSSDAFSKTDETRTKAEQVAAGINSVLGPYGAFLLKFTDDERKAMEKDPAYAERMFQRHREASGNGKFFIVLKPASKDTVARWSYMRELLRFRPVVQETEAELKQRLADTFARGASGSAAIEAYERELAKVKRPEVAEHLPRLQVWRGRCPGLIRCMEEANKDEDHSEKIAKWDATDGIGGDDALESCFVAGTLIETDRGARPIEEITIGDLVHTRFGLRSVIRAGMTSESADVLTLTSSDGRTVTGTANHPIFIENYGFKRLDTVGYGDKLHLWQEAKSSRSMELNSEGIRTLRGRTSETIFGPVVTTAAGALMRCIEKSGNQRTGRSLRAMISITWMKIRQITNFTIYKQSESSTIIQITEGQMPHAHECAQSSRWDWRKLQNGTDLRPVGRSGNAMKNFSGMLQGLKKIADGVGLFMKHNSPITPCSVVETANNAGVTLTLSMYTRNNVNTAILHSKRETNVSAFARAHVLQVSSTEKRMPVFNLTVDEANEYFANGILVHNCGHGLHHFKDIEKQMPKSYFLSEKMEQIQADYEKNVGERLTDPTRLIMVQVAQANRFDAANQGMSGGLYIPRASSSRHRKPHGRS